MLNAADDAFITGIRVAMLLGFLVSLSSLAVGWWLFPRRGASTIEEVALEPGWLGSSPHLMPSTVRSNARILIDRPPLRNLGIVRQGWQVRSSAMIR